MNIIQRIKAKFSGGGDSWLFALRMGAILVGIVGVLSFLEWYADWRSTHAYQSPIVFRSIIYEIEPTVISPVSGIPTKTEEEIMEGYRLAPVLKTVYFLESTAGKNDGCKEEGKVNGFGYAQNGDTWKCFDSFEAVVDRVNDWFEERLAGNGNNLAESVCYYNTGIAYQDSCVYSQNFMGVIVDNLTLVH